MKLFNIRYVCRELPVVFLVLFFFSCSSNTEEKKVDSIAGDLAGDWEFVEVSEELREEFRLGNQTIKYKFLKNNKLQLCWNGVCMSATFNDKDESEALTWKVKGMTVSMDMVTEIHTLEIQELKDNKIIGILSVEENGDRISGSVILRRLKN